MTSLVNFEDKSQSGDLALRTVHGIKVALVIFNFLPFSKMFKNQRMFTPEKRVCLLQKREYVWYECLICYNNSKFEINIVFKCTH